MGANGGCKGLLEEASRLLETVWGLLDGLKGQWRLNIVFALKNSAAIAKI